MMVADRVRVPTSYPLPPDKLVADLARLVAPLPAAERASVGFPGMVRDGMILSAPHFSTKHGPGSAVDPELAELWSRFDLASTLARRSPSRPRWPTMPTSRAPQWSAGRGWS